MREHAGNVYLGKAQRDNSPNSNFVAWSMGAFSTVLMVVVSLVATALHSL